MSIIWFKILNVLMYIPGIHIERALHRLQSHDQIPCDAAILWVSCVEMLSVLVDHTGLKD